MKTVKPHVSALSWAPWALLALLVSVSFLLVDAAVQSQGLMARDSVRSQERAIARMIPGDPEAGSAAAPVTDDSSHGYYLAAVLLTLGYVVFHSLQGHRRGMHRVLPVGLESLAAARKSARLAQRMQNPSVQMAKDAIERYGIFQAACSELKARIADPPSAQRIRELQSARPREIPDIFQANPALEAGWLEHLLRRQRFVERLQQRMVPGEEL